MVISCLRHNQFGYQPTIDNFLNESIIISQIQMADTHTSIYK